MDSTPVTISFEHEEALKAFKGVLPDVLVKELKKAIQNNDKEKVNTLINTKVKPILDDYQAKVLNFNLNEGEEVLWIHEVTKGIIHKETVEKWIITNLRALRLHPISKDNPKQHMISIGLALADTVVMNQYRSSTGSRVGTFTGAGGRFFAGAGVSIYTGKSQTYGDLIFFFGGKQALCFRGISDPHGVRRMVETLKKQGIK